MGRAPACIDKSVDEAQFNSKERYRHLFEHLPVAIWQFDLSEMVKLLNELRAEGVTGFSAYLDQHPVFLYRLMDALVGEDANERAVKMFGARDRSALLGHCGYLWRRSPDTFRRAMESRFRGEAVFQEETKFITFDGHEIDVLFSTARFGSDGLSSAVVGLVDITERNRAQEKLRQMQAEAERELRLTIDTIPTMVATFRADGTRDFVNNIWRDYFGPSSQEATDERQARLFPMHPEDAEVAERWWQDSLASGLPLPLEVRLRRSDGKYRWHTIRCVPLSHEGGDIAKWYGVAFDIEDQKVAENALRHSEALLADAKRELQATLDCIPTLAWRTRADGFTEYLNKRWLDFTGISLDHALGWQWQTAIHPDDMPGLDRTWQEFLASGASGEVEARMRRFDGAYRWFIFRAEPLRDATGAIVAWYGTNTDIEDSKRYRDMQMELAHANRLATMGQLTASIAHETYQPITGTVANADAALRWLDSQPPNLQEVRQALRLIMQAGIRAGEVIDRIRALIRKAPPRKDRLDINAAIGEVVALIRGEAVKNGVSIQMQLADPLPSVQGDRVQLQQVLLNLIINAFEAMSATNGQQREIVIRTGRAASEDVVVTVGDSGPGLAPAALQRVFESFHTTKPNGLGLGLSICRSIIENHGGRLWASQNVPLGAEFNFTVPAHP